MENKILLSFAIPTYNRARFLEKLLNNVLPQARKLKDEVEICISNNGSTDLTRELVFGFQKNYPDVIIKYKENEKNLGVDANIIKVVDMCDGDFIWTFGDDDHIVDNGLNMVVNLLKKNKENYKKDTGLIVLRVKSWLANIKTGKKEVISNTFDKNKPEIFKIDRKDIIGLSFPYLAFISILIYNNELLKELLAEDRFFIEQGIGTSHIHIMLITLIFLKYPNINGIVFNKEIVCQELSQYKYFIEDKFMLHYQMQRKLNDLLLSYRCMNDDYAPLIFQRYKGLRWDVVVDMISMRMFKSFNYFSYFGCLKLFFQHSIFIDGLLFSSVFSILFLIPPVILISCYKGLLIIRHGKEWKAKWDFVNNAADFAFKGTRRRNEQPH
ncbi:MAG: glycosyltransferase family 2 protein [Patescibacteria group bacterium]